METAPASDVVQTLYAQNKQLPLHADLSRFPPGYSTGERFYASEGPVGLAWVFLSAGTHAVIAASWGQPTPPHCNSWTVSMTV